jgi:hypothetical protein
MNWPTRTARLKPISGSRYDPDEMSFLGTTPTSVGVKPHSKGNSNVGNGSNPEVTAAGTLVRLPADIGSGSLCYSRHHRRGSRSETRATVWRHSYPYATFANRSGRLRGSRPLGVGYPQSSGASALMIGPVHRSAPAATALWPLQTIRLRRTLGITLLTAAAAACSSNGDLQCVPYARERSGIALYGDASTWWERARGSGYTRGALSREWGSGARMAK